MKKKTLRSNSYVGLIRLLTTINFIERVWVHPFMPPLPKQCCGQKKDSFPSILFKIELCLRKDGRGLLVLLISVERCQHFRPPLYSYRVLVSSVTSILRSMAFAFLKNFTWELHCLFRFFNPLRAENL